MLRHGACGCALRFSVQDIEEGYKQIYDNDLRYKQIQNKMINALLVIAAVLIAALAGAWAMFGTPLWLKLRLGGM